MINAFKGKIDTHKAVVKIFNNKSDHLINTFGMIIIDRMFLQNIAPPEGAVPNDKLCTGSENLPLASFLLPKS